MSAVPAITTDLQALEREIATEHCRVAIETLALRAPSSYPAPVYDISALDDDGCRDPEIMEANRAELARSVRYLDLREALYRPAPSMPQFVTFKGQAHG